MIKKNLITVAINLIGSNKLSKECYLCEPTPTHRHRETLTSIKAKTEAEASFALASTLILGHMIGVLVGNRP